MKSSKDYGTQSGMKKNPIIAVFAFLASLVSSIYHYVNSKFFIKTTIHSNENLYTDDHPGDECNPEYCGAMSILLLYEIGLKTLKIDDKEIDLKSIADIKDESDKINNIISLVGAEYCAAVGSEIGVEYFSFIMRNFMKFDHNVDKSKRKISRDIRPIIQGFAVVKNGDVPHYCATDTSTPYPPSRFLLHDDGFLSNSSENSRSFALLFDSCIQSRKHHYRFLKALDFLPYVKHRIDSTKRQDMCSDELYGSGYNFFPCSSSSSNNIICKQFLDGNGIENSDEGIRFRNGILDGFAKAGRNLFDPFLDDDTRIALEEIYSIIGDNHNCIFSDTKELLQKLLRDFESDLDMINDSAFYNYLVDNDNEDAPEFCKFFNKINNGVLKEGEKFGKHTECKLSLSFHSVVRSKEKEIFPEESIDGPNIINIAWAKANFVDLSEIKALYQKQYEGSVSKINDDRCDALDTYKIFLERTVSGLNEILSGKVVTKDEEPLLLNQLQKVLRSVAIGVDDAYYKAMMSTLYMHSDVNNNKYNKFFSLIKDEINKSSYLLPSDSVDIENLSDLFMSVLKNVNITDGELMKYGEKEVDDIFNGYASSEKKCNFKSFHKNPCIIDYICSGYIKKVIGDPCYKDPFSKHSYCLSDEYKELRTRFKDQETKQNINSEVFLPNSIETISSNENIQTKGIM